MPGQLRGRGLMGAVAVVLMAAARPGAHHSVLAYDGSTATTITGAVVRVLWQNPHTYIALDVPGEAGGPVERWTIESEGPGALLRLGWTNATVGAGDTITSTGARARDGSRRLRCRVVVRADGARLPCFAPAGTGDR